MTVYILRDDFNKMSKKQQRRFLKKHHKSNIIGEENPFKETNVIIERLKRNHKKL